SNRYWGGISTATRAGGGPAPLRLLPLPPKTPVETPGVGVMCSTESAGCGSKESWRARLGRPGSCACAEAPIESAAQTAMTSGASLTAGLTFRRMLARSLERCPDSARCLRDPLLVLDQREPDVAVAGCPEAGTGADGHLRLAQQPQRKRMRPLGAERLRDRRPDEHRAFRRVDG